MLPIHGVGVVCPCDSALVVSHANVVPSHGLFIHGPNVAISQLLEKIKRIQAGQRFRVFLFRTACCNWPMVGLTGCTARHRRAHVILQHGFHSRVLHLVSHGNRIIWQLMNSLHVMRKVESEVRTSVRYRDAERWTIKWSRLHRNPGTYMRCFDYCSRIRLQIQCYHDFFIFCMLNKVWKRLHYFSQITTTLPDAQTQHSCSGVESLWALTPSSTKLQPLRKQKAFVYIKLQLYRQIQQLSMHD